jgi:hypothetical protein
MPGQMFPCQPTWGTHASLNCRGFLMSPMSGIEPAPPVLDTYSGFASSDLTCYHYTIGHKVRGFSPLCKLGQQHLTLFSRDKELPLDECGCYTLAVARNLILASALFLTRLHTIYQPTPAGTAFAPSSLRWHVVV